jgi:predicted phosphoribosyltransferase
VHFRDRTHAGQRLARYLLDTPFERPLVMGVARRALDMALPVSRVLAAELEVEGERRLGGRDVILVEDGLSTSDAIVARIREARRRGALHVLVAAPVASPAAMDAAAMEADSVMCLVSESGPVPERYACFAPPGEEELTALLARRG